LHGNQTFFLFPFAADPEALDINEFLTENDELSA